MSIFRSKQFSVFFLRNGFLPQRKISISSVNYLDQQWRKRNGLSDNPNRTSVLLDGPDYTFIDGRPTPYGTRQKFRIMKQREYTDKIIKLTKEVDFAVERFNQLEKQKQAEIDSIIKGKLKQKGTESVS